MNKLDIIKNKIITYKELNRLLNYWRFRHKKVVFTNGCFDILHRGHIEYLAKASSYGNILVIGMNTDDSVRKIKGPSRPFQDEKSRSLILASLHFVNAVVLFSEETPYNLINKIKPDVLIKGADYKPENIVGYDLVKERGGEIITIEFIEGHSSTKLIGKLDISGQ